VPLMDSPMTQDFQQFAICLAASEALIEQATIGEIAEAARMLALQVAHYEVR
jgi:hypothetical protein